VQLSFVWEFIVVESCVKWQIGTVRVSGSLGVAMSHSPLAFSAACLGRLGRTKRVFPRGTIRTCNKFSLIPASFQAPLFFLRPSPSTHY
jgi:hypothetical protein